MPDYRRLRVPGGTYFFTVNLLERRRTLLVDHIAALRVAFPSTQATRSFYILAMVILPDHLHCLWRPPANDADNAARWRQIKTAFSRDMPRGEHCSPWRLAKAVSKVLLASATGSA